MSGIQEECGCGDPDVTSLETCLRCSNSVSLEDLRQRAVDIYERDGQPAEDPTLHRRYRPLEDSGCCLRLLRLNGGTANVLSGEFEYAWIHRVSPYEAVSYVWGGEDGDYTKSEFIVINGKVFPITKNCAAVLRKIRKRSETRVVWIDSLCINQNDVKERSVQVSQMGKIFSGAQKVHIYLGNNVDDMTASDAFDVLDSMGSLDRFDTSLRRDGGREALKTLFSQTYFSRMWIIQEVLLAKTAELHWGTAEIRWQTLSEDHLKVIEKYGIGYYIPKWMRIRATTKNFRKSETLGELLFSAMDSTASNDRDKVYGIYGLLFDAEEEGLTVDYSLSVRQVFTNMAVHLIKKHNALQAVLRHASCDRARLVGDERLPSWVPDFRSKSMRKGVSVSCGLDIRSSLTPEEAVSSCGQDELCLRGHRLTVFRDRCSRMRSFRDECSCFRNDCLRFREHRRVVEWRKAGEQKRECEIRGECPVLFDPEKHALFWMPNGLLLQLERHRTMEGTYKFLGECTLEFLGPLPAIVVHNRERSFADAMFSSPGSELHEFKFLWKVYASFGAILPDEPPLQSVFVSVIDRLRGMGLVNADKALNIDKAFNKYRDFCLKDPRGKTHLRNVNQKQLSATIHWILGPGSPKGPSRRRLFSRRDILEPDISMMFDFEDFWESQETWKVLHRLDRVLEPPGGHNIQHINELCLSWLIHYENAENLIRQLSGGVDGDMTPRQKFLIELEAWERTTEELSKTLQWAEGCFWPFESLPWADKWDFNQSRRTGDKEPMAGWVIKNNFKHIRLNLDRPATYQGDMKVKHILRPWGEEWYRMIRSIPQLSTVGAQFGPAELLQLKELLRLEEGYLRHIAWIKTGMRIFQAETITLL